MDKHSPKKAPEKRSRKRSSKAQAPEPQGLQIANALHGDSDEPMSRGEAIRMAAGVVMLALAAFTLLSFASHLFTGGEDQKVLQPGSVGDAQNWAGYIGAWWSEYWMTKNFGLGAFFIPVFLFAASLKLTGAYHVRLWKWFINCTILLCWVSVAAAFFFTSSFASNPDVSYDDYVKLVNEINLDYMLEANGLK